jgi:hypothetical protein
MVEDTSDVEGTDTGKEGNTSGAKMPSRVTTIPPLRKSCANARLVCCLPLYFDATKLRSIKARPPTTIHGNQVGIIGELRENGKGSNRVETQRIFKTGKYRVMKIYIFANCQGGAIARLLTIAGFTDITHHHNYTYIYNTTLDPVIENNLKTCDVFIYQPLSATYPIYNTNNLLTYIKSSCITISFPYIYNDALVPLYIALRRDIPFNGEYATQGENIKYGNIDVIAKLKHSGHSLDTILKMYYENTIDFDYERRMDLSINILKEKEDSTDIKIADFILNNHKKMKLFNYHLSSKYMGCNHPSNALLVECANQILTKLGKSDIVYSGPELIAGTHHVSRYDLAFYKFEWATSETPQINTLYANMIVEMYNAC